jgi:hypothetical protein
MRAFPPLLADRIFTTKLTQPPTQPKSKNAPAAPGPSASFRRLLRYADNFGDTDESRALNYLLAQHEELYHLVAAREDAGFQLSDITVAGSRLIRSRHIVDPVITFTSDAAGVPERYFVRVDVTHKYPMIINGIEPYGS